MNEKNKTISTMFSKLEAPKCRTYNVDLAGVALGGGGGIDDSH